MLEKINKKQKDFDVLFDLCLKLNNGIEDCNKKLKENNKKISELECESMKQRESKQGEKDTNQFDLTHFDLGLKFINKSLKNLTENVVLYDQKLNKINEKTEKIDMLNEKFAHFEEKMNCLQSEIKRVKEFEPSTNLKRINYDNNESENPCKEGMIHENMTNEGTGQNNSNDWNIQKILLNSLPSTKDWPRFIGRVDVNFYDFIDFVDGIKSDMNPPDEAITCRFSSLFTGIANYWFVTKRKEYGPQKWEFRSTALIKDFGTAEFLTRLQMKFEKDKFEIGRKNPAEWVNRQIKRLEAFAPECTVTQRNRKLMFLIDPETSWSIKVALQRDDFTLSELINVLNSLSNKAEMMKEYKSDLKKKYPDSFERRPELKNSANRIQNTGKITCYNCKKEGHIYKDCPKKVMKRGINEVNEEEDDDPNSNND